MPSILFQSEDALKTWLTENGEKPFRASQILSWLSKPGVTSFDDMKNLPAGLKQKLADAFTLRTAQVVQTSQSPWATKALLKLFDGETVECAIHRIGRVCVGIEDEPHPTLSQHLLRQWHG